MKEKIGEDEQVFAGTRENRNDGRFTKMIAQKIWNGESRQAHLIDGRYGEKGMKEKKDVATTKRTDSQTPSKRTISSPAGYSIFFLKTHPLHSPPFLSKVNGAMELRYQTRSGYLL